MSITAAVAMAGIELVTLVLQKIWSTEENLSDHSGDEKKSFVKQALDEHIEENNIDFVITDAFIDDFVELLNDHGIFEKRS